MKNRCHHRPHLLNTIENERELIEKRKDLKESRLKTQFELLDFIEQWDDGFDTIIGERGAQLSGGQRARLALARAILRDSHVLLFDEISAALDSVSEAALHSALQRVLQDRTTLLIAHRWSSIQIADRIAVLGDGKVIEIGTPQDLLSTSTDSAFRRLVEHQLKAAPSGRGGL